jgi:hypothetical protein
MRQPHLIAKRRDTAVAACGTHREHQNAFNVIHEEFRVNTDFRPLVAFMRIAARWLPPKALKCA